MSNRAMNWVWENAPRRISAGEMLLLVAIADQCDDKGETYPSIEYLARKTRSHFDTTKRCLNALIADGIVERIERLGRSNLYRLRMDPPAEHPGVNHTPLQNTPGSDAGGSDAKPPRKMPSPLQNTPGSFAPPEPKNFSTHLPLQGGAGGDAHDDHLPDAPDSQAPPARPKRTDRGTRIPDEWAPPPRSRERALTRYPGRDREWWLTETEKFVNHFRAAAGAKGRKVDWGLTWENWIHTAVEREPTRGGPAGTSGPDRNWDAYRKAVEASRQQPDETERTSA